MNLLDKYHNSGIQVFELPKKHMYDQLIYMASIVFYATEDHNGKIVTEIATSKPLATQTEAYDTIADAIFNKTTTAFVEECYKKNLIKERII